MNFDHSIQVYRKAAFRVVRDLPETEAEATSATGVASENKTHTVEDQVPPPPLTSESLSADSIVTSTPSSSSSPSAPVDSITSSASPTSTTTPAHQQTVTTEVRKPVILPDTIHVHITPENLKDFVGPPVYHKDRFYTHAPPAGVSTGLGYLGNGSGAVMPVEATVSFLLFSFSSDRVLTCYILHIGTEHARKRLATTHWQIRRSHP